MLGSTEIYEIVTLVTRAGLRATGPFDRFLLFRFGKVTVRVLQPLVPMPTFIVASPLC
jgi:hypothetical protein